MNDMVYVALVGHFLGDFVLQFRKMAEKKSEDSLVLLAHIAVYTSCLIFTLLTFVAPVPEPGDLLGIGLFGFINGVTHFGIDAVTSRMTKFFYKRSLVETDDYQKNLDMEKFWMTIGLDQLLHGLILVYTAEVLLR